MKEASRQHFNLNYPKGEKKAGTLILVTNSLMPLRIYVGEIFSILKFNLLVINGKEII